MITWICLSEVVNPSDVPMTPSRDYMSSLDYLDRSVAAEVRIKRGERQKYCRTCGRWMWPEECGHTKVAR